jgi:hypothetical protein
MQGSTPSRGAPMVALFAIVGGLLSAVGSFLAWASVSAAGQGVSAKGTDGTDGYITLVAGIILILYGVSRLTGSAMGTKKAMAVIAIVAGLVAGGVAVYDAVTAKERVLDEASSQVASSAGVTKDQARTLLDQAVSSGQVAISLSFGIFVVMAGGVLGLIGGVMGLRSPAEPAPEMSAMGASAPASMSPPANPEPLSPPATPEPLSPPPPEPMSPPAPLVPDVPTEPDTGSSP